jgi:pimeloyl-ACP methyl ester carboxylesterase
MQLPLIGRRLAPLLFVALIQSAAYALDAPPPWTRLTEFAESSFTATIEGGIRIHVNAPLDGKGGPAKATRLIVYALPAGNTLEQTLGCKMTKGLDWHYDIQHIAAQTRLLRTLNPQERIVLVCAEAPKRFWPYYRKTEPDANRKIARLIETWRKEFGADDAKVLLAGHSAGGSFMFGLIEGGDEIPSYIDRIAFLDSNYSFDATKHAAKLERWLKGDDSRRLIVIAYDDREITLNGKKVVGPTGGTYRATGRMRDALGKVFPLTEKSDPPFNEWIGLDGRIHFYVHPNPENKILHTALVGDMNGFLQAATLGTPYEEKWGKFGGPRAFTKWVQAEPTADPVQTQSGSPAKTTTAPKSSTKKLATKIQTQLPPRPKDAVGGTQFMKSLEGFSLDAREAAILREITSGNFPDFLRHFKQVPIAGTAEKGGKEVSATLEVMPDYLAVGSDSDFVRVPMTPQTAQQIADRFGCTLPTRKMVDAIDRAAEVRLAPHPMTREREAIATFLEYNQIIERERGDRPLGLLVIGTKKDIVLTPRIFERPQRLAIYGWRQLNGEPIQPLTIVHWNRYVDYSHGARLVRDQLDLDGKSVKIYELLADPNRCGLVSDEGPMNPPRYPPK